jgi:hypothetical protein
MRTYKRKLGSVPYRTYSEESFNRALQLIEDGVSQREAANICKVPRSTLSDRCAGRHVKNVGGQSTLSPTEESDLVSYIVLLSDWGFPLDGMDLHFLVKNYLEKQGRTLRKFKGNLPGQDWVYSFLKRNRDQLTTRLANNIKRSRAIEIDRKLP